mmetsp:Transcript_114721/g.208717  ORF Transcript_114721/g.208717 Transcript_114721/m.208717 type:complete len:875 (+) Transcript_114721:78-2702(+)
MQAFQMQYNSNASRMRSDFTRSRCSDRPAKANGVPRGKRATCPWINSQIVQAAESEDLQTLLTTIATHLPLMNLVNVSTALHRLAKLNQCRAMQAHQPMVEYTLQALVELGRQLLEKLKLTGSTPKCQSLSNIAWALATLKVVDLPLVQMVSASAQKQLAEFKSFELCQLLWALAKLGTVETDVCDHTAALFHMGAQRVVENAQDFSFRGLVMIAWAFATARQHDTRLFCAIASQLTPSMGSANCQELANTAWSFATAGIHAQYLFSTLASLSVARVQGFKPQELSSILWSYASIGHVNDEFYEVAGRAALEMNLQAQQLANILWALAKMRPLHESTKSIALILLPRCTQLIDTFKMQELASVALAASKCFGSDPEYEQHYVSMPPQVIAFFHAALPLAARNLKNLSGQSLANIASSFLAVDVGELLNLFLGIAHEITDMRRVETLENSALLLLLKTLLLAPQRLHCQGLPLHNAIATLFEEAARRASSLPGRELRILSRLSARLLGGTSQARPATRATTVPCENWKDVSDTCACLASWHRSGCVLPQDEVAVDEDSEEEAATNESAEEPNCACNTWATPITFTVASTGRPLSNWDAQATEQLRQDMEVFAAQRVEASHEPVNVHNGPLRSDMSQAHNRDVVLNVSVRNTFIDMEEDASQNQASEIALEPALPCIPDCVSKEKLHAHRLNYRRFRTGNGIGAKGEWDAIVNSDASDKENSPVNSDASDKENSPVEATHANNDLDHWTAPIKLTVANTGRPASSWDAQATEQLRQGMETVASRREAVTQECSSLRSLVEPSKKGLVVNVSVKNTFIDMEESSESDSEIMEPSLGPALDFVPDCVPADKLQSHRMNYRRFRAGNGKGAKGELDAVF